MYNKNFCVNKFGTTKNLKKIIIIRADPKSHHRTHPHPPKNEKKKRKKNLEKTTTTKKEKRKKNPHKTTKNKCRFYLCKFQTRCYFARSVQMDKSFIELIQ